MEFTGIVLLIQVLLLLILLLPDTDAKRQPRTTGNSRQETVENGISNNGSIADMTTCLADVTCILSLEPRLVEVDAASQGVVRLMLQAPLAANWTWSGVLTAYALDFRVVVGVVGVVVVVVLLLLILLLLLTLLLLLLLLLLLMLVALVVLIVLAIGVLVVLIVVVVKSKSSNSSNSSSNSSNSTNQ